MLDPVREPDALALRRFVVTLPLALCVLGGVIAWQTGVWGWGLPLWVLAGVVGPVGVLAPGTRRPIWHGFMTVTAPIRWVVSMVLLSVVYFGVLLPMGLLSRTFRGDRLGRRFDRTAATYWAPAEVDDGPDRRFRPF
jgi:hypothetical protein